MKGFIAMNYFVKLNLPKLYTFVSAKDILLKLRIINLFLKRKVEIKLYSQQREIPYKYPSYSYLDLYGNSWIIKCDISLIEKKFSFDLGILYNYCDYKGLRWSRNTLIRRFVGYADSRFVESFLSDLRKKIEINADAEIIPLAYPFSDGNKCGLFSDVQEAKAYAKRRNKFNLSGESEEGGEDPLFVLPHLANCLQQNNSFVRRKPDEGDKYGLVAFTSPKGQRIQYLCSVGNNYPEELVCPLEEPYNILPIPPIAEIKKH